MTHVIKLAQVPYFINVLICGNKKKVVDLSMSICASLQDWLHIPADG